MTQSKVIYREDFRINLHLFFMPQSPVLSQSRLHDRMYGLAGIFQRHFFRSLVLTTLGTSLILSLLIWLVQSLRYCGMMAYQGLSLQDVFYLSCHLLPRTWVMGTSWGFVVGMVWTYRRWHNENAFTIMRSCGVSPWFFNQPTLLFSIILTGFLYSTTLYFGPMLIRLSLNHGHQLHKRFDPSFITAGIFFSIQGRTLYVHDQPSRYHLKGVFLHDHQDPKKEFILCGQSAHISPHNLGFRMRFENGSMHVFPQNSPPYLAHFKSYTLNCAPPSRGSNTPQITPLDAEKTGILWKKSQITPMNPQNTSSLNREVNYRLFWPMMIFLDALWVPPTLLFASYWMWPLCMTVLILHVGMLSPWPGMIVFLAVISRIIFWRYTRKKL